GGQRQHSRVAVCRHPARRGRRGRQILRAADRRLHHLCRHGGHADLPPPWPVRPSSQIGPDMTTSTSIGSPSHPHPGAADALARYRRSARWKPLEYVFWCLPVLAYFAFPGNYLLLSQIAITSLFALSLDLIFGYAGIISLGHAAFFGVGAYTVGLLGSHGLGDP